MCLTKDYQLHEVDAFDALWLTLTFLDQYVLSIQGPAGTFATVNSNPEYSIGHNFKHVLEFLCADFADCTGATSQGLYHMVRGSCYAGAAEKMMAAKQARGAIVDLEGMYTVLPVSCCLDSIGHDSYVNSLLAHINSLVAHYNDSDDSEKSLEFYRSIGNPWRQTRRRGGRSDELS